MATACPLGFGGPKPNQALSNYHCPICKSLLFDAVSLDPCGHVFCRYGDL